MATIETLAQELANFQLNELKRDEDIKHELAIVQGLFDALQKNIDHLRRRIEILEEARTKQIALNQTFAIKATLQESPKQSDGITAPKKWIWF